MNDQATGDMPWLQSNIKEEMNTIPPARQSRQQRKPREAAAPTKVRKQRAVKPTEAAPAPKQPRVAKAERAAPDTIKVTLKEFAQMRVGDDAKLFLKLHGVLSSAGKASRTKVLAELSKVFG